MRVVPFGLEDITRLAAATAAPLLPLGLTIFSLEELIVRLRFPMDMQLVHQSADKKQAVAATTCQSGMRIQSK